ncbi:hypothetical protein [Streptomyces sp. H27-D2]|uniref:hypothetical protein n=1 Tax=Streptomyces sp. H27-D2 TaxID=3046304 RepID=UPI002DB5E7BE|nr:hypothetical protein [Streptomyces sp. H27-D2]MEC4020828.1 hypothetical protein [Streptomyces sp. H27-D2]
MIYRNAGLLSQAVGCYERARTLVPGRGSHQPGEHLVFRAMLRAAGERSRAEPRVSGRHDRPARPDPRVRTPRESLHKGPHTMTACRIR